jgi:hypothetical protein
VLASNEAFIGGSAIERAERSLLSNGKIGYELGLIGVVTFMGIAIGYLVALGVR